MHFKWNIAVENDVANGNVGVVVTAATDGLIVRDLLPPTAARQLAATLLQAAEQVAPTPRPEPTGVPEPTAKPTPAPAVEAAAEPEAARPTQ